MNGKGWVLLCVLLLLPACGPVPTPTPVPAPTPIPGTEPLVEAAVQDLLARVKLTATDVRIKNIEAVDWPDTSLGCPQPGMVYAQVITPGYKITLAAESRDYVYHTDRQRVVYCPPR